MTSMLCSYCLCLLAARANNARVRTTVGVASATSWIFTVVLTSARRGGGLLCHRQQPSDIICNRQQPRTLSSGPLQEIVQRHDIQRAVLERIDNGYRVMIPEDEREQLQKEMKGLLNKITPEKYDVLAPEIRAKFKGCHNEMMLELLFSKAVMEQKLKCAFALALHRIVPQKTGGRSRRVATGRLAGRGPRV